jgi:electron transfer flavoprotein beta subunit
MKFVVCVTLAPDTSQLNEITPQRIESGDLGVTMVLNPWDEFAVEEALQLAERYDGETSAISMGNSDAIDALKQAVAMGMHEAVLVSDPAFDGSDAWGTAQVLAQVIKQRGEYSLVLTGRQSIDGNSGLVGPGLAVKLGVPFVSQVARVLEVTEHHAVVQRALDEGRQTVRVRLPAVISVSKEINEPRFASFMGIRKASRMQYPPTAVGALPGLDLHTVGASAALVRWTNLRKPPSHAGTCEFIEGATVSEKAAVLVDKLIAEKVI